MDKLATFVLAAVAMLSCIQVEYAGKPLESRMTCHWKVRVWLRHDKTDNRQPTTDNSSLGKPSAWSAPACWSMGLLNPQDFKAKWIGAPTDAPVEPAPLLRKTFSLDKKIERATAYISGLGYYELTLNGQKVGDHVLDPKFTRYDRRVLYVTYDITRQLKNGYNAMGVMLGNGWYNYHVKNPWSFDTAPWRAKPKMLLQLEIAFLDGTTQTIISDESWKYSTGPIQFDGMLSGEIYDARLEKEGWNTAGYDDSKWVAARVVDAPKGKLTARMVQPIRVTEVLKPVKVSQPKPGVYLYDMGQNIAGTARLTVTGPAGTEVKIQYAELLHDDGTLNPDRIKVFCQSAEFQTERYVLKGKGTEIWQSRFMYHGFQYVQVTGFPGEPKLANLEALVMHTDLENAGTFECSNGLLNKIQHCTRWSYLNNFHGHPTDCPNREKIGWTGDAHVAAETGLYNFDASAAYTQWMLDFKDEQRDSGELPGIVPTGGWGYWIKQGATTLWEKWDDSDGSHNHVMFGDVSAWFFKSLAGICPDESGPGFKKIIITPAIVGDLTWVECGYDSIHGRIVSNWQRDGDKLTMDVTIPANTTATVYVPAKEAAEVTESGKPAGQAESVEFLRTEKYAAIYAVGSGTYRFQSTLKSPK